MDDARLDMADRRSTLEACSAVFVDAEQEDVSAAPPAGPAEKDWTDETSNNESSARSDREFFIMLIFQKCSRWYCESARGVGSVS